MPDQDLCSSAQLRNGGPGLEFEVLDNDEPAPAFAVRFRNVVYAYINRCSHMELELNFLGDDFFDLEERYLICATHGALYDPTSGACAGGPCNGIGLIEIPVTELDGRVVLSDNARFSLLHEER